MRWPRQALSLPALDVQHFLEKCDCRQRGSASGNRQLTMRDCLFGRPASGSSADPAGAQASPLTDAAASQAASSARTRRWMNLAIRVLGQIENVSYVEDNIRMNEEFVGFS